jgi:isoquinoline 1-oxidoreductase beta subunit
MTHIEKQISRRFLLKSFAGAGGSFVLGFNLPTLAEAATYVTQPRSMNPNEINAWIEISRDNIVTIRVPHTEQGQGGMTSVCQLVTEELDMPWENVRGVFADMNRQVNQDNDADGKADNPYINTGTAGSALVRSRHPHLCGAGASARERLKQAAAEAWGVPRDAIVASQGVLTSGTKSATYGDFAEAAAGVTLAEEPKIKAYKDWWLLGKDVARMEIPAKVNGSAQYCIDVELDNMVYVAVKACPVPWGKLVSYDKSAAEARPGVLGVVDFRATDGARKVDHHQDAVAVVADSWYRAKTALDLITIEWDYLGLDKVDDAFIEAEAHRLWDVEGKVSYEEGQDARPLIAAADPAKVVKGEYYRPFETHARMEPINATVHVQADRVDVWSPMQNQATPIAVVADELGISTKNVYTNSVMIGGAFGGNGGGNTAVTRQAAAISQQFKRPAKVIWSREEDIRQDKQRPPHHIRMQASLGANGLPEAYYSNAVWFPFQGVEKMGPAFADATIMDMPYVIANRRHEKHDYDCHIPSATHRGPGVNQNTFISEQFADQMAIAGGWDPLEWRLEMTKNHPKESEPWQRILKKMKEVSGFTTDLPKGQGMGIAMAKDHGSYAASCATVSVSKRGALVIEKIVIVHNSGYIINPRAAIEQLTGAAYWEMSHAMTGGLQLKGGQFVNTNFDSYNLLRMKDSFPVECHFALSEDQWWGGVGEPGGPPTPAAVANAIYFATGRRITSTPIMAHDLTPL